MPFFNPAASAAELQQQALEMYSNQKVVNLNLGRDFTRGLHAIVEVMLRKMSVAEFTDCLTSFQDGNHVEQNLLYFAEVAHQIANQWANYVDDTFYWHFQSALWYSTFLDTMVLKSSQFNMAQKLSIQLIINEYIALNIHYMVEIDAKRVEQTLQTIAPDGYLYGACRRSLSHYLVATVQPLTPLLLGQTLSQVKVNDQKDDSNVGDEVVDDGLSTSVVTPSRVTTLFNGYPNSFFVDATATTFRHEPYNRAGFVLYPEASGSSPS